MGEIRLDHCCRLCLKEGFSLTNIFSHRSAAGDPLYLILNFIYEMKIFEKDGLPSQICSPCMWRMIEFDACKRNVRSAEAEIMRLLNQTRPHPDEVHNDSLETKAEENEMEEASAVGVQCDTDHSEDPIKEELDILESEKPIETDMKHQIPESVQNEDDYHELKSREVETLNVIAARYVENCNVKVFCEPLREGQALEAVEHFEEDVGDTDHDLDSTEEDSIRGCSYKENDETSMESDSSHLGDGIEPVLRNYRNIMNIDNGSGSSKVILQGIDLEVKQEESELIIDNVGAIQSTGSSDSKNHLSLEASEETVVNSFKGESIYTTQDNCVEIINKGINEEASRDEVVSEEESTSAKLSESILNDTESELSHFKAPLSKSKSGFICDICKKSFPSKAKLGLHLIVHYDVRPFSCNVCKKTFKQDNVRYVHELRHLRDKIGNSRKGSKKNQHSCGICSKNLSSKKVLAAHLNLHSDKYKCKFCGKCFKGNGHLSRHVRIHTKETPFKCEVCSKRFTDKSYLNRHLPVHSSERSFPCDTCDKRFKTKQHKTVHELSHLRK